MSEIEVIRARAAARARASAAQQQQPPGIGGVIEGAMAPVNEGIARGIDSMAGTVNRGVNAVIRGGAGIAGVENPYQFDTQPTRTMMGNAGIDTLDGQDPQSWGGRAAMGVGEAASYLLPAGIVGRGMQALGGVAGGVGQALNAPFVSAPVRATGAEMAAGAGARVGGEAAAQASGSDNSLVRLGGEVVGGLAGAMGPGMALRGGVRAVEALPVAGTAIRAVKGAVAPFTQAGARVRAEDRVRGLVSDPQASADQLRGESIGNLTPAQRLNDENLLRLERTASDANPRLREELDARRGESSRVLQEELRAPANAETIDATRQFVEQRRAGFRERIEGRVAAAQSRADERVRRLDPVRGEAENSVIVREELDRAYNTMSNQERALWARIDRDAEVVTDNSRAVYAEIEADTPRAMIDDLPPQARDLLSGEGLGPQTNVRELHGLYSRMRRTAREAMGQQVPNENKARISNMIADAILEDLGAVGLQTRVGQQINEARAFSSEVNRVFSQGTVGTLTSRQRSGGDSVAPEVSLSRSLGRSGSAGAVAARDIREAGGTSVEAPMEDFLRGRVTDTASPRGTFNPDRADDFVRNNRETMQQFPQLQGDIGAATSATRQASAQADRVSNIVRQLDDRRGNAGAALLNAGPGNEIAEAVFKARNPAQAANALLREARRDSSGRALDGLKGGFLDHLIRGARSGADSEGQRLLSGNELNAALQDDRTRAALAQVFSPSEITRMGRIARELQGVESSRGSRSLNAVIDDVPNSAISFLAGTIAARQGAALGAGTSGASLRTANLATQRMNRILGALTNDKAEQLIMDAIVDPELMASLMTRPRTEQSRRMVERRLTEWAIATGAIQASDLAEGDRERPDRPGPLRMTLDDPGNQRSGN